MPVIMINKYFMLIAFSVLTNTVSQGNVLSHFTEESEALIRLSNELDLPHSDWQLYGWALASQTLEFESRFYKLAPS